ncbi:dapper homolog 2 [Notolabrus celidotus]|uniref:dapper homolog 2 n=1 Tax=Notolabrus celidotus TaxID=1203425 RepID=UPI0014900A77|nr:dapper homolog 2 [Notolabrus celidotus]
MISGLDMVNPGSCPVSCGPDLMRRGSGADSSRMGERLQAALAGLQELSLLRDRQSGLVARALRGDREDPGPEGSGGSGTEEQRLEATLTALKLQLSRLRKQDLGLKSHLQQLDQQISELKLDVRKVSTEQQESDSRPSSGFYELSDGGSLSNSCTSVYSECLSSSQSSLHPLSPSLIGPQSQTEVCRRHSADETFTQPPPPRASGLHLGSSRIRASSTELGRQRPVSTGDLDGILAQGLGFYKPVVSKKSWTHLRTCTMDPKSNLVSGEGTEVNQHAGPLYAVAQQFPVYFQGGDPNPPGTKGVQGPSETSSSIIQRKQMGHETKTLGHIDKPLLKPSSRVQVQAETLLTHRDQHQESSEGLTVFPEASQRDVSGPAQTKKTIPTQRDQNRHLVINSRQQIPENRNQILTVRPPQGSHRISCPSTVRESSCDEVSSSSLRRTKGQQERVQGSEKRCEDQEETGPQERRVQRQRSGLNSCSRPEDTHTPSPQFVHAKFVPAGSQRIKVRQADHKTRALKLRKPPTARQQHSEKTRETRSKGDVRRPGREKLTQKYPSCQPEELRPGSSSDYSPSSTGTSCTNTVYVESHPIPSATRSNRVQRPHNLDYDLSIDMRSRRKVALIQTSCVQRQQSRGSQVHPPGTLQTIHNARLDQWTGPAHSFPYPVPPISFHHSLDTRYPPAPCYRSSVYPPRCESEYSAECASLFHSTVAGSSEGELSDYTTNCFGDNESSWSYQTSSESNSSLSIDQEDQEDPEDCLQDQKGPLLAQAGSQQLPHPRPSACRIKASRALKKKIRRFQPASLKIMTLV